MHDTDQDFHRRKKDRPAFPTERLVRFFITVAGPGGAPYPIRGHVVYGQMLRDTTFPKTPGMDVDAGVLTDQFAFLGITSGVIPDKGSLVSAEKRGNRWWLEGPGVSNAATATGSGDLMTCVDNGSDLSLHCQICPCSADPWILNFATFACNDSYGPITLSGPAAVFFSESASYGGPSSPCVWLSAIIYGAAHTFQWQLTVYPASNGVVSAAIDLLKDNVSILTWSCDNFCCTCESCFTIKCNTTFPLPCPTWPREICITVTKKSEILYTALVGGCCDSSCPYGVPLGWTFDAWDSILGAVGYPTHGPYGPLTMLYEGDGCNWTGSIFAGSFPNSFFYAIIGTLTLPCDGVGNVTLTLRLSSNGVGSFSVFYTCPIAYWNCEGSNTFTYVSNGADAGGSFPNGDFPPTITVDPAAFLIDQNGNPILDPNGQPVKPPGRYPCVPTTCQVCMELQWTGYVCNWIFISSTCSHDETNRITSTTNCNAFGLPGNIYCFAGNS
jgi:hypothetical protein